MSTGPDSGGDGLVESLITSDGEGIRARRLASLLVSSLVLVWLSSVIELMVSLWSVPARFIRGVFNYMATLLELPLLLIAGNWSAAWQVAAGTEMIGGPFEFAISVAMVAVTWRLAIWIFQRAVRGTR